MGLASHFRDLLVCKNQETIDLLEVGEQVKAMYLNQSKNTSPSFLIEGIEIANTCDLKYKTSRNQRLLVELCLMQLASITFNPDESGEKKKPNLNRKGNTHSFVIPPSYFSNENGEVKELVKEETVVSEPKKEYQETKKEVISKEITPESTKQIVEERPKIIAERNAKRVSALSLKSIQKKQELKEEIAANKPQAKNLPTEVFSEKEMLEAWNKYSKKVEKQGKYNLLSHLTMGIPKLKDQTILLEFPNNTIKVEVERAKYDLLTFLKETLQNFDIDLEIVVNETVDKKYAYTPIEKYEKLKEKNPMIDLLRKEFDLDL